MRNFSSLEKEIIRRIVHSDRIEEKCPVDIFQRYSEFYQLTWNEDYTELSYVYKKDLSAHYVHNKIFDIVSLFKYLEENRLISVFPAQVCWKRKIQDSNLEIEEEKNGNIYVVRSLDSGKDGVSCTGKVCASKVTEENGIGKFIEYYAESTFHASQELREFVKNKFKTEEQMQFEKNYKLTWRALAITAILGLVSIIISIVSLYSSSANKYIFYLIN